MEKFEIEKLRALPIEGVAERLGLNVQKHKSLCPFHDDSHPSLSFHVGRNTYKCFVCDAHGGPIDLTMKLTGKPFLEACRWLADEHNVILTEWEPVEKPRKEFPPDVEYLGKLVANPVLNAEAREFLFRERRIHPAVVQWLGITSISVATPCWRYGKPYYDAPSLLFPYRDRKGRLMNVQSRYLGRKEGVPRFRFPSRSECRIYGLQVLERLKTGEGLWLSEGVTDCFALLSSGRKAIAIPGATLLKPEDVKLLASLRMEKQTVFHIFPDRDEAGERLYRQLLRAANEIGACLIRDELPEGCKDFGQCGPAKRENATRNLQLSLKISFNDAPRITQIHTDFSRPSGWHQKKESVKICVICGELLTHNSKLISHDQRNQKQQSAQHPPHRHPLARRTRGANR